jgi:ADP-ribosyl-[dinitrogen reductase] hydrolase
MTISVRTRFRGALLGLACGDAVGTTVEFRPRNTFPLVTEMVGGGPFNLLAGQWTDDTSMALCLATSLLEKQRFDPQDQMERYVAWMQSGYLSSTGRCFDIGNTTAAALQRFMASGDPYSGVTNPGAAGNGSIMRLAPVVLFGYPDQTTVIALAGESSRTTHGAAECVEGCRLLSALISKALRGATKTEILFGQPWTTDTTTPLSPKLQSIADGDYRHKPAEQINGSGYVVESLEAALWAFWSTNTFRAAVLAAVNLGDDADTTAAVCGQLAGAYYGESGIPAAWLAQLHMADEIRTLADRLLDRLPSTVG